MTVSLADQIIEKVAALKAERANFEKLWQDVSELVLPRKSDFSVLRTPGASRTRKQFETTAVQAAELLAAGIHGLMTNPAGRWFSLSFDGERGLSDDVRAWIGEAEKIMRREIAEPAASFATNIHEVYLDLAVLGTAGLYVGWNENTDSLLFQSRFLGELFLEEDSVGCVSSVYRVFRWPLDKIVRTWGKSVLPESVSALCDNGGAERSDFEIIHAVTPNPLFVRDSAFQKPVRSVYVLKEAKTVLFSGGFDEMPLPVVRWSKATGEVYGRSPAIASLPDIKMLQEMMRETLISAQLANRPPVLVRDDDRFSPAATVPGGIIRYNGEVPKPFLSGANLSVGTEMMNEIRARLRAAFYNDVLLTEQTGRMTATEVVRRNEEKMILLGPVFGRIQTELLGPVIKRVFGLLLRHGKLPPLPAEFEGRLPDVSYLSPLSTAQSQIEARGIVETLETSAGFLKLDPSAAGVFNVPKLVRKVASIYGVSPDLLTTEKTDE